MKINYLKCAYGGVDGFDLDEAKKPIYECTCQVNRTKRCAKKNHEIGQFDECEWARELKPTIMKNGMRIL